MIGWHERRDICSAFSVGNTNNELCHVEKLLQSSILCNLIFQKNSICTWLNKVGLKLLLDVWRELTFKDKVFYKKNYYLKCLVLYRVYYFCFMCFDYSNVLCNDMAFIVIDLPNLDIFLGSQFTPMSFVDFDYRYKFTRV